MHLGIPVDEPLVAIDQPFAVQSHENPPHRYRQALIHREALACPIGRCAEAPQLIDDRAARLGLPLPNLLDEPFPTQRVLVDLPLGELAGDDDLGRDTGMIGAGLPQGVAPAHPLEADQDVLQREIQRVSHMQAARHVGRRHHDRVGALAAVRIGGKAAGAFPSGIVPRFDRIGAVGLVQHR